MFINATDLQADIAILRSAFTTLHPGLLRYNTPAMLDTVFAELLAKVQHGCSRQTAFIALSQWAAKLQCSHTYPNPFNQPEHVAQELLQAARLPFGFCWLEDRMVVTRVFHDALRLAPGSVVTAINAVPTSTILQQLMTVARADGANDAKRRNNLEVHGTSRYEAFDCYFPLFFPWDGPTLAITIQAPGEHQPAVRPIPTITYAERLAAMPGLANDSTPGWSFAWLSPQIGYLRMPTWVTYQSDWDWRAWLVTCFERLVQAAATTLVLDLRGNEGGTDAVGQAILAHLAAMPLPLTPFQRKVRYRRVPAALEPYLSTWDASFKHLGEGASDCGDGFLRLADGTGESTRIEPAAPHVAGQVFVLVDAANSSATFQFAVAARRYQLATLVGSTTGGNQRGMNGGAYFFLRLPNTNIELDLPLIGYFPEEAQPDGGIDPDIPITATIADIASGRDAVLQRVLA